MTWPYYIVVIKISVNRNPGPLFFPWCRLWNGDRGDALLKRSESLTAEKHQWKACKYLSPLFICIVHLLPSSVITTAWDPSSQACRDDLALEEKCPGDDSHDWQRCWNPKLWFGWHSVFCHEVSKCDRSLLKAFHMEETPVTKEDLRQLWSSGTDTDHQSQISWEGRGLWPMCCADSENLFAFLASTISSVKWSSSRLSGTQLSRGSAGDSRGFPGTG